MTNRVQLGVLTAALAVVAATSSLRGGSQPSKEQAGELAGFAASAAVDARLAGLRTRFQIVPAPDMLAHAGPGDPAPTPHAAIARGVDTRFQRAGEGRVKAVVPGAAKRGIRKRAHVELPLSADGVVRVTDDKSGVAIGFRMRGARPARLTATDEGIALYPGAAPEGGDVVHRVHAEGTEDFVAFETKPEREALEYEVDVSHVPGLRLVSNVLEFLEANGTPALRVAPPYVVGKDGVATAATIRVDGCAYDENTAGPWGRAVTAPGAAECNVRVYWAGVTYPALVDPSWVATGSMATARYFHTATLLNSGKVLVAGGYNGSNLSSAELYDGTSSFSATGPMGIARRYHTATLLNSGKVLVAGGYNGSQLSSAELYDGTSGFTATGSMAAPRSNHKATLLASGKALVAGGFYGSHLSSAELYDGTSSFAATGSMAAAREAHTVTLLDSGKVLVAGGFDGTYLSSAELYDGTSSFTATAAMATARGNHTATLLGSGTVLIAGGRAATILSSAELFDETSSFAATGSMGTARTQHTATLLSTGKVLIAGGSFGISGLVSTELYDGTSSFGAIGSLGVGRGSHTATLLNSGKVLVAGGYSSGVLSSAELFELVATGGGCGIDGECVSDTCNERCCSSACAGPCTRCDGTGACVTVTSADDPDDCTGTMTCSTTGACGLKTGQPSGSGSACASGHASDGVCCDTACGDPCDVCTALLGASSNGACTPTPGGNPGSPGCGKAVLCNGTLTTCPPSCLSDANCAGSDYCGADGACHAQKVQGDPCDAASGADCQVAACRVCTTGQCVDGFCCDSPCMGTSYECQACAATLKQSGTGNGTCGPARASTNPHNDACPTSDPTTCGASGQCDGNGGCQTHYPAGTSCGPSQCSSTGNMAQGQLCNGGGACQPSGGTVCDPYLCASGACPLSCATNADCTADAYCTSLKTCALRQLPGEVCTAPDQCANSHCVDGFCCDTPCMGSLYGCQACAASLKESGTADGTCGPAKVGTNPHADACAPSSPSTCGAIGSCNGFGGCQLHPAGTSCGASQCSSTGNAAQARLCNGTGTCQIDPGVTCDPYLCASGTCPTTCASNSDCVSTAYCTTANACVPRQSDGAACTAPDQCANGHCVDGVCCDQACAGQCQACDLSNSMGTCSPVVGAPHGSRAACTGTDAGTTSTTCGGACDGVNAAACTYPGGTTTCGSACTDSTVTPSACNGQGTCVQGSPMACSGNLTCADAMACKSTCTTDIDCVTGFGCTTGTCAPKGSRCIDAQTSQNSAAGSSAGVSCIPYKCDESSGTCLQQCTSADDCVSPNVCNAIGECVVAGGAKSRDSGGCAIGSREASHPAGWWVAPFGLVAVRRRRPRSGRSVRRSKSSPY